MHLSSEPILRQECRVTKNIDITQVSNMRKDFLERALFGFKFANSLFGIIMGIYLSQLKGCYCFLIMGNMINTRPKHHGGGT